MPTLTVHHLNISQSERIPWLCEELAIPYEPKTYKRAPIFAPPELKALHPSGAAPIIQDGDLTLAESGACIEYIAHRHAGGALFLPPTHPAYAQFVCWWHWANGTF
ncbi:putative glutathione S-transferase [Mycena sanguinolenta]|uniref:Putative glutathione S-transferase n=1 Tax=Mycena sanguinolenta TaxID=230812 RepID=A0A8H7DKF7_9AGAR|nr:putative glutathione S-transferase [Mycena sanguinolenta]